MNTLLPKYPDLVTPDAGIRGPVPTFHAWLIATSMLPLFVWYVRRLNDGSDEPLGLVALGLAVLLAWLGRKSLQASCKSRTAGALLILAAALMIPWLPPMPRALMALTGLACFYGLHRRIGLLALLLLSLPVAASLQFWAGYPLRVATAEGVVQALKIAGVVVARLGTSIAVDGRILSVDPACSGIRLLWHALVATAALAAIHRLSWGKGVLLLGLAAVLTLPANQARALVLVVQTWQGGAESSLRHELVGLVCAASMLGLICWLAARNRSNQLREAPISPVRRGHLAVLMLAAIAEPCLAFSKPDHRPPDLASPAFTGFTFEGLTLPLEPLPSTPMEQAFAATFPGTLGCYGWSGQQVILRRVTTATRRLHPSRDCLRAAGYDTTESIIEAHADGSHWASFTATRGAYRLRVRERIVSEANDSSWTDPSAWYWDALLHPLNGPWRAETVIESN